MAICNASDGMEHCDIMPQVGKLLGTLRIP